MMTETKGELTANKMTNEVTNKQQLAWTRRVETQIALKALTEPTKEEKNLVLQKQEQKKVHLIELRQAEGKFVSIANTAGTHRDAHHMVRSVQGAEN